MFLQLRYYTLIILAIGIFAACASPERLMYQGKYDEAVSLAVQRLSRNKKSDKNKIALEQAFNKAQARDLARIEYLKKEGQPNNWEEVTVIYNNIQRRQTLVTRVMPLYVTSAGNRAVTLNTVDVTDLAIDSKKNVAAYLYARAQQFIAESEKNDDVQSGRAAFAELNKIDQYFRDYKDKETLKIKAHNLGMNRVFVRFLNESGMIMPAAFEDEMLKVGVQDLNSEWIQFVTRKVENEVIDFDVLMQIKQVQISPEQNNQRQYIDTRRIEDGSETVLGSNGKPLRDSLGRPIVRPVYLNITADITEIHQIKTARVGGQLEFYSYRNNRRELVKTYPINAESVFENYAATFRGDKRALTPESQQRMGNQPRPFPNNEQILMSAADKLKPIVKQAIADNRLLLEGGKP